jgi:ketosteroid isomerase-like protein
MSDVAVVEQMYSAFARGDMAGVMATFDEAVECPHVEPHELCPLPGGRVLAFGVERAHARATGTPFEAPFVHVFTLRAGRVTAMRGLVDTAAIRAAFGN